MSSLTDKAGIPGGVVAIESQSPPAPVSVSLLDEAHRSAAEVQAEAKARAEEYLRLYEVTDAMGRINPVPVLLCRGSMLFSLGAISLVAGRAKGRKTFFTTMLEAAYLYGNYYTYSGMGGNRPERPLLHIDTEQAQYKVYDIRERMKRIVSDEEKMSDADFSRLYRILSMAGKDSREIKEVLKSLLHALNPGFVVVDVGTDLVGDTNDNGQSSDIYRELLELAKDYNTHICIVAHTNPNDPTGKARGHFGSEGERRCECVFVVEPKGEYSKATIKMIRHKPIEPDSEYFYIDTDGLPKMFNGVPDIPEEKEGRKYDELQGLFLSVFQGCEGLRHGEIVQRIMEHCRVSRRTAIRKINDSVNFSLIRKEGDLYILEHNSQIYENEEDLPF
ncbi:AAA family ATPase [Barnesiella intestinihominis]|uniref:AAA family ATPase n=1 Tax=Barnesiella intestinihominis TaxID=487174 RepID=UPI00189DF008|nr:AAA family ATPase [Barnesiella intestinihominis]MDB0669262.1 AAA family ATPase [Barnesiella intestinihominis]